MPGRIWWGCATVALLVAAVAFAASEQTWTGKISDSACGAAHIGTAFARKMSARECTQACVRSGSAYVFVVGQKVYKIANQRDPALARYAGSAVIVTGEQQGDAITISAIREPTKGDR